MQSAREGHQAPQTQYDKPFYENRQNQNFLKSGNKDYLRDATQININFGAEDDQELPSEAQYLPHSDVHDQNLSMTNMSDDRSELEFSQTF